ncbi:MAG: sigma-70 family RNA polymerase sigma factor [Candidatus Brocadiaceae bacterium]|nr:sigma-70 family RNA polymerase sigma factor [Candidatus Brocadiaceae bacterium]
MRESVNPETRRLVAGAKSGDKDATNKLYEIYNDRILGIVRLRMGNELRSKMQSMDLVQEALLCSFRDLGDFTYKNEGDFLRWVSKIAENRIRDNSNKLHAQKRDMRKEAPFNMGDQSSNSTFIPGIVPFDTTTPSRIMSRNEEQERLEMAMQHLSAEDQEVIVLAKIEGLLLKQIGEKIGKSPDAVRMQLSRALAELSAIIGEANDTES